MLIDSSDPQTRQSLNLDAIPPYGVKPVPRDGSVSYFVWNFPHDAPASESFADRSEAFRQMDRLNAVVKAGIQVFEMDDCTWYAGASVEEVTAQFLADMREQAWKFDEGCPRELTYEEMTYFQYVADPGARPDATETFRDALARMLAEGREFPSFFATTEF